ncbi:hypothetical protein D584_01323 [Brucella intermedia M86]|uniref:Uncharacterized protein n=1 Tax=Brucella intermedia M86 TaxID=1234597 RepID=M5JSH1_9HYPH|nr:hypothetical protein D584_01323 [Brucella intermedia M86]
MTCCAKCGKRYPLHMLDAKPTMTFWLHLVSLFRGQKFMLQYAADHGYDFGRLECRVCYGDGYVEDHP